MNEQNFPQQNESIQSSKNIWIIIASIVITALIVGGVVYVWQKSNIKSTEQSLQQQISALETQLSELKENPTNNNQQTGKSTVDTKTTNNWQLYEDKTVGFSLKYPKDIALNQNKYDMLSLNIKSEKIDTLDYPMNYNKETAEEDRQELIKGNYGKGPDWPLSVSKKVRSLGSINGQEFMVLARFEVCDVTFERKLIFYHNGYQTIITLHGNKNNIISNNSSYFKTDQANCGSMEIWDFEKQGQFYQDLVEESLSEDAQTWFNLFDDIINTINIE
jgi:type II secretory pathway pseudopilin PulG